MELAQLFIPVRRLDRAVAFYRDVLQIPMLFAVDGQPMAFFQAGSVRLYPGTPEGGDHRSGPLAYSRVSDLERECRRLHDVGVELLTDPHLVHRDESHELWMASFHDSEGNTLVVMEEQALG